MRIDNSSNSKAFYSFPIVFYMLETPIEAPIGLAGMLHYFIYRCYGAVMNYYWKTTNSTCQFVACLEFQIQWLLKYLHLDSNSTFRDFI